MGSAVHTVRTFLPVFFRWPARVPGGRKVRKHDGLWPVLTLSMDTLFVCGGELEKMSSVTYSVGSVGSARTWDLRRHIRLLQPCVTTRHFLSSDWESTQYLWSLVCLVDVGLPCVDFRPQFRWVYQMIQLECLERTSTWHTEARKVFWIPCVPQFLGGLRTWTPK